MKLLQFAFLFYIIAFAKAYAQQPDVELIEDKQPKRWLLYAQNNTNEEQEAFLIVQGTGFRRSADRPVIKKVPPNEKVLMITLIPLKGVTPEYKTIFTFENQLQTISKRKGENDEDYVNIRPLKKDELTIFVEDSCDKCNMLIEHLNTNHIKYRRLDVNKNGKVRDFMWGHLKDSISEGVVVKLPVIMEDGEMHFDIFNMQHFINTYSW